MNPPPKMSAIEADWRNDIRAEEGYNEKINELAQTLFDWDRENEGMHCISLKLMPAKVEDVYRVKAIKVYRIIKNGERTR